MKTEMTARIVVAAMLVAGFASSALAQSFPKIKAGLWENTVLRDGTNTKKDSNEPITSTMCIDDTIMEQMMKMGQGMSQKMCSKNTTQVSGNKMTGSVECKMGNSTISSTSTTTFNSDTSYRTESKSVYNPPLYGMKETVTVSSAKYVGPCKAGMKPGDINTMGITMNILDMNKAMGAQK
jgi:hypothetical protein